MADTLNVRDPNGNIVPVSVDDLTSLNGSSVTDVHIQRFKAVFGSDGIGQDVDAAHPLPVDAQSVVAVLNTILTELQAKLETGQPVDLSAGTLAALENVTATIAGTVDLSAATLTALETIQVGNFPATQTVSGTVQVANFPVTQPVSGAVSVSNLPATQPVSGTVQVGNFPAAQTVDVASMPEVEVKNDAGSPVPVTVGNLPATQPVSGAVSVSNLPATQAVTAASLPLPAGAAQEHTTATSPSSARLTDGTTYIGSTAQRLHVSDGGVPLSVSDNGGSLTVDGAVNVSNFPATQPVSGSVGVNNFPATQAVSGAVSVSNLPATQAVSAAALPLPAGAATDASLTNGTAQVNLAAPTASAPSSVAASTSSVTLAAANATRRGLSVYNDGTANLFVKHGATASASSFTVKVPAGGLYELPAPYYRGVVDGIWDAVNGSARITELS